MSAASSSCLQGRVRPSPPVAPRSATAGLPRPCTDITRQIIAADHVEYDIHATPHGYFLHPLDEILGAVIDRMMGADFQRSAAFFIRPAGDDRTDAERKIGRAHV